jgi:hypothetical protein
MPDLPTAEAVSAHLDHLETLPKCCLALADNPRITVRTDESGSAAWLTDTETGQR